MSKSFIFIVFAAIAASPAMAANTTLTATGTVSYVGARQNGNAVATPSGSIKVGDAYTVSAKFDLSQAQLTSLFDADPTVNIYYLPGTTVTYSIGPYKRTFVPLSNFNASVQLWNGRPIGNSSVDSQTFEFFDYNVTPVSTLPFDLGIGPQSALLRLQGFDFSATARNNDLISYLSPFSAFASRSFSFGQQNSNTNLFVSVQGDITSGTFGAVPEPASWGMMIFGLGAVGWANRRREQGFARAAQVPEV